MFTATDEDMQQIEQQMECLIERTKHKCKRCSRFFSNESVLKQHHCELPIKKRKCPHCGKTINRANNLEKNLRSFEKVPTHPVNRQLCLDGPTSSKNRPSTPKKLMLEDVQVGGAPSEHAEHRKASEIVEPTLKYTTLTFRKTFNSNNKRDVLHRLKEVIHSMRLVIEVQTRANEKAVKWYLLLNMNFCKSTSPGIRQIWLLCSAQRCSGPSTPTISYTNFM